jgi:succinate-semialdehyde dehydrogenase/glutarate-semialdehyde dehydrogenase
VSDLISLNPATGEVLARVPMHGASDIELRLAAARQAQRAWARVDLAERAACLRNVARQLRAELSDLARTISLEMGKPLTEALAEVEKCALNCDYFADAAPAMLADEDIPSSAADSRVVREPLGLILAVMPWNYPLWQVMRAVAPIIAAGNGLVLKHASSVPQCALAVEAVCRRAGLPEGLVTTLLVGAAQVPSLIADDRIAGVTFTGSTPAGRSIASAAGQALKKQVLELGGSDPFIVLSDADVEAAAAAAVKARFQNTGQSCIAAKRFIVEHSVADWFAEVFCARVEKLVVGDPLARETTQGSMAAAWLRDELDAQVKASLREGATLLLGGQKLEGPGAFYQPTVFDFVEPAMTIARDETFGPVAAILRVPDAASALRIANDTPFGLGAALWTSDLDHARRLTREMEAGAVFVNGVVASDPRLPFGGIKASGYGRELGRLGLHEFTNPKTVWTGPSNN